MINKELLLAIPDLKLAGRIENMSSSQYENFIRALNSLVDSFPSQADRLRNALNKKEYSVIAKILSDIQEILNKIYADNIARECQEHIRTFNRAGYGIDHDEAEASIEDFIQSVSNLSVDIQMQSKRTAPRIKKADAFSQLGARINTGRPLILAVDNAVMFLNTLKKLMSSQPYELYTTTSCSEALDYARRNRPDIILLDIEMPEMDGYELARRIRASGITAPIIYITANSDREHVDQAIREGAAGLLMKPLRIS